MTTMIMEASCFQHHYAKKQREDRERHLMSKRRQGNMLHIRPWWGRLEVHHVATRGEGGKDKAENPFAFELLFLESSGLKF